MGCSQRDTRTMSAPAKRPIFLHPAPQMSCLLFGIVVPAFLLCINALNLQTNSAFLLASIFLCLIMLYAGINAFDPGSLPGVGRPSFIYGIFLKLAGLA